MGFFSVAFGLPVVQTDDQSFERCQSRDYQIFSDGEIYLAMGLRMCSLCMCVELHCSDRYVAKEMEQASVL